MIAAALVSAVKKSGLHTIGVLYTTDTSGTHQLEAAQAAAKTAGLTVVSQPQTAGVTDVTPQLLKLKSMGADVFYLASIGANTAAAVSSYKTLGLTVPVVAGAAAVTNAFLKSLPNGIPANLYGTSELIGDTTGLRRRSSRRGRSTGPTSPSTRTSRSTRRPPRRSTWAAWPRRR